MADCDVQIRESTYDDQVTSTYSGGVWQKKVGGGERVGGVWQKEEQTRTKVDGVWKLAYHHCTCEGRGYCSCDGVAVCSCELDCTCHSHYCSCHGYSSGTYCECNTACANEDDKYDNCRSRSYGCWSNHSSCSCFGRCCSCMEVTSGGSSGCRGYACHPVGDRATACPGNEYVYCDCKTRGNLT